MIVDIQINKLENEFVSKQIDTIEEALSALSGTKSRKYYKIELDVYTPNTGQNTYTIYDRDLTPIFKLLFNSSKRTPNMFDIEVFFYQHYSKNFYRLKTVTYVEELIDILVFKNI